MARVDIDVPLPMRLENVNVLVEIGFMSRILADSGEWGNGRCDGGGEMVEAMQVRLTWRTLQSQQVMSGKRGSVWTDWRLRRRQGP